MSPILSMANRREAIDVHALTHQLIRDMKHDDFADENGVLAQRLVTVQFAFHARLRFCDAGYLHAR